MNGSFKEFTISLTLWLLLIIYACARVLQLFPQIPTVVLVALHVLPPALFALIHGALCYGLRNSIAFMCICLLNATVFESLVLRTGFPFGHYFFTDVMGPKISGLPVLLAFAYVGMAYLAWTLTRLILGGRHTSLADRRLISLPLVAAFLMVAWDFSMEPVWSTVVLAWIWIDGDFISVCQSAISSAGISPSMFSISCSQHIYLAAITMKSAPCTQSTGIKRFFSMRFPRLEICC